jgi:hypothetical protein
MWVPYQRPNFVTPPFPGYPFPLFVSVFLPRGCSCANCATTTTTTTTTTTISMDSMVSGHSTFSRAAAELLTHVTGSPYFPDGLGAILSLCVQLFGGLVCCCRCCCWFYEHFVVVAQSRVLLLRSIAGQFIARKNAYLKFEQGPASDGKSETCLFVCFAYVLSLA